MCTEKNAKSIESNKTALRLNTMINSNPDARRNGQAARDHHHGRMVDSEVSDERLETSKRALAGTPGKEECHDIIVMGNSITGEWHRSTDATVRKTKSEN